jgi:hypothetical protein
MSVNFKISDRAIVNKTIPKNKFYEKANLNTATQKQFVERIEKIISKYKISESTTGINKTENISEIHIFEIHLRQQLIPKNIIKIIDKAIKHPILFVIQYKDNIAYATSLKRNHPQETYYYSEWNQDLYFDFSANNLDLVYQQIIKAFIDYKTGQTESFEDIVSTDIQIKKLENEIKSLENKLKNEKQFNRKVEINKVVLQKKNELKNILKLM